MHAMTSTLKLRHVWVMISDRLMWMQSLIHALDPILFFSVTTSPSSGTIPPASCLMQIAWPTKHVASTILTLLPVVSPGGYHRKSRHGLISDIKQKSSRTKLEGAGIFVSGVDIIAITRCNVGAQQSRICRIEFSFLKKVVSQSVTCSLSSVNSQTIPS